MTATSPKVALVLQVVPVSVGVQGRAVSEEREEAVPADGEDVPKSVTGTATQEDDIPAGLELPGIDTEEVLKPVLVERHRLGEARPPADSRRLQPAPAVIDGRAPDAGLLGQFQKTLRPVVPHRTLGARRPQRPFTDKKALMNWST